jgi:hypothetical protein
MQQKSSEDVCNVNINRHLIRCDVTPYDDTVPDGTICSFSNTGTHPDTVDMFVCHHGLLLNVDHKSTGMYRIIHNHYLIYYHEITILSFA